MLTFRLVAQVAKNLHWLHIFFGGSFRIKKWFCIITTVICTIIRYPFPSIFAQELKWQAGSRGNWGSGAAYHVRYIEQMEEAGLLKPG